MTTAEHEAVHAAAAVWSQREVEFVVIYPGGALPGEALGHMRAPISGQIDGTQMVIALSARMADPASDWPLPYEQAREEPLEGLSRLIKILEISEEQYDQLVALTRRMLDDEHFQRLAM